MLFSSRPSRRAASLLAAAATTALVLTSCSSGTSGGGEEGGSAKGSITIFNGSTGTLTRNFNPFSPSLLQPTLGVIYESLYYYNLAEAADPVPMLGTGYTWNADGTELTIKTRQGATWSDGKPFTAKDVAFTFSLIAKTPAINASGLELASATAPDDQTAVLTFSAPSFTTEAFILGNTPILPEHIWSTISDPAKTTNENPVGTGPYKVKSFESTSYVLEKNTSYWQPGKPEVNELRYISLATADAASAALVAGQVDWMSAFLPGLEQILQGQEDLSYVNTPALTTSIFTCSSAALGCSGPQTDPAVRQAMYYAIDRDQLNKLAGGGFAATGSPTMLLPERDQQWIADPANATTPSGADAATANQLLDAAGWVKGADGIRSKDGQRLSMTIQTVTGYSDYISLNDAMTQELKAVGIEIKPTQLAYNEWNNNQVQGTFQLSLDSIGLGPSSNPYYTYQPRYSTATTAKVGEAAQTSGNYGRYSNPVVDQALGVAATTNDETVQKQQYAAIQTEIVRDMPYIPIYVNSTLTEFNNSRATGWPTNDDKYAFPASWKSWDNGQVLINLKPVD
ncbi:ABC transporter substrate-binding protein [Kineococcus sp. R8]|uniref:ABC transporter substrate-binding protein n=1 Tax=Kineococcus siccus TaxID=2696567 RepID=UPI0014132786|nr:ABC transporter substrate-binding protein [Kineococcus siccus]NAZ83895.1 ABC transporter substrate-binding protein [Kineococcus siccus]